jgi:putative signal transducing protein
MKLVYTHPTHILVAQARSSIELAGIECIIRNEYASGAIGELAPIDAWPELWVAHDRDFEGAIQVIEQLHTQVQEADWKCEKCGMASPATFDWCWKCAGEKISL